MQPWRGTRSWPRISRASGGWHSTSKASSAATPSSMPEVLRILHHDHELVAIDKPAGLLVHPSALDAHEERTAMQLLRGQLGEHVWPLQRLDKATSGVLLFARNAEGARRWGMAFEAGEVRKAYVALVRGWPAERGEIDYPL